MARGDRTPIANSPLIEAIIQMLETAATNDLDGKVNEWQRPKDNAESFVDPPYVLVREYPSAGQFSGDLADTKSDAILRVQVLCLGRTAREARRVRDWTRRYMQRSPLESILDTMALSGDPYVFEPRAVMDLSLMVAGGGDTRDDDLPTPLHSSTDLYELWTTPKTVEGS